jgi:hypothetical protein
MSYSVQQQFVSTYLPYAQSASQQTGLPVDFILGQAAQETGWGTSSAAVNQNNFFGISPGGSLASYSSPQEGFDAYANLINSGYSGASSQTGAFNIASSLQGSGYATDPNYATGVAGTTSVVDQILGGSSGGTQPSPGWSIFGWDNGDGTFSPTAPGGSSGGPLGSLFGGGGMMGGMFGSSSSALNWVEELGIRVMLVIVGIVLIGVGFAAAARGGNQPAQIVVSTARAGGRAVGLA